MTPARFELFENRATAAKIFLHLVHCDSRFVPPLSARVDLVAYSRRLHEKAHRFEAWADGALVGMVAAYFNSEDGTTFISNVSVDRGFLGLGVASALLARAVATADDNGLSRVQLHVGSGNVAARRLYNKFGFRDCLVQDEQVLMRLDLRGTFR